MGIPAYASGALCLLILAIGGFGALSLRPPKMDERIFPFGFADACGAGPLLGIAGVLPGAGALPGIAGAAPDACLPAALGIELPVRGPV